MVMAARISGIAMVSAFGLALLATMGPAIAGEVATKAAEAENLLSSGKTAEAIDAFDAAADAFWKAAPLGFRKALFVDSVNGFGDYVPHQGSTFAPKSELTIYAEPIAFGWSPAGADQKVDFTTTIEIRSEKGIVMAKSSTPAALERTSHSKTQDFHITIGFPLPALKPGSYQLIVTVTDASTGKSAPIQLPLTIS